MGELDLEAVDDGLSEDPDATLTLLVDMGHATDERLRGAVRRLAPRLILDQTRRGIPARRGVARPRPVPAHRGGDLDLDRSLEAVASAYAERRKPSLEELTATDWARPDLALCLLIDHSGSMTGHRLTTAAVTGAACLTYAPQQHAVLAFAAVPRVLTAMGAGGGLGGAGSTRTVEAILALRGHGVTGLAGALAAARTQLAQSTARRKVTLLLSDCRATDDVDAVPAARACEELVVLAPDGDDEEALRLGREAGARVASVATVLDVPKHLNRMLTDNR